MSHNNEIETAAKLASLYNKKASIFKRYKVTFEKLEDIDRQIKNLTKPVCSSFTSLKLNSLKYRIQKVLDENPDGLRPKDIIKAVGATQSFVSNTLSKNPDLFYKDGLFWKSKSRTVLVDKPS